MELRRIMKEIPLTQGYGALVDDEDYEELSKHKWHVALVRGGPRAMRNAPRVKGSKRVKIYMSRQIMNAPSGMPVDHWDHDTLNNQRANLRVCTRAQNAANQKKKSGCSSQFKRVYWHKGARKWVAKVEAAGRVQYLGLFVDEVDAAWAYNVKAVKLFGEFALLNDV